MYKKFTIDNGQLMQEINGITTPCLCPFRNPIQIFKANRITGQNEIETQQPGCNVYCHFFEIESKISYDSNGQKETPIKVVTKCTNHFYIIEP